MTTTTITGLPNAATPLSGAERVPLDQPVGAAIAASALSVGTGYRIESVGSTNWTACGLPAGVTAAVGLTFVATAAGTGTGTAIAIETRDAAAADIAALAPGTNLVQALIAAGVTAVGSVVTIPHLHGDIAGSVYIHVKNTSAGTLTKGTPVRVTGAVGDTTTLEVAAADSASAGTMPAIGILGETLAPNATGHAVVAGELTNLATGSYSIGEALYVASGGGLTATKPTSGTIQQVAIVGRVNASTGSVTVTIGAQLSPTWDTAYSERLRWDGGATGLNAATGRTSLELGSAAQGTIGTAAGNVVALDGSARLPAVDASQLTGLPVPSVADGTITDAKIAAAGLSQSSLNGSAVTPWAPSTAYAKGALVSLQGIVYRRKTAGTTGATFDPTMWDQQTATELSNSRYYTVGKYFNPSISSGIVNGQAIAGSTIVFFPFEVRRRVRINGCRVRVAVAVAATTFQIAIYAASATNVPTGLPLVNTGDMSMAVTTAVDSSLTSTWLEPGVIYFRSVNVSGGTTGVFSAHVAGSFEFSNLIGAASPLASTNTATSEYSLAWTYGTWPDMTSRTVTESTTVRCPVVPFLVQELG